jgi:hypothetical protein
VPLAVETRAARIVPTPSPVIDAGFAIVFSGVGVAAALSVAALTWFGNVVLPAWTTPLLVLILILSFSALSNLPILFTIFAQSGAPTPRRSIAPDAL